MSEQRFLAFDLGAESGRGMVGTLASGRVALEEIHRFPNEPVEVGGTLYWDVLALYGNILKGMAAYARRFGPRVAGVGIDTWAIDFGLLARDGSLLQNPVCYRDRRTEGLPAVVADTIPREELYALTGLNLLGIETLCQLLAMRRQGSPILESAHRLLMMPDLLGCFLTGRACGERSNAITSMLYDPRSGGWSDRIAAAFGLPGRILPPLVDPGTVVGELTESVRARTGLGPAGVIAPCTHDTGSAVAAIPGEGADWAFISSGTWSVVGTLTENVVTGPDAFAAGLCNELTAGGLFLCRNTMGLWLLQQARAAWRREGKEYPYAELAALAAAAGPGGPLVNADDPRFLAPADMPAALAEYCRQTGQTPPVGVAEVVRCILESLALSYRRTLDGIGSILGRRFRVIHVIGGGSRNSLLCRMTAGATGLPVVAGPAEATAMGNILVQALARGEVGSVQDIRDVVRRSTELARYEPGDQTYWADRSAAYRLLCERSAG